MPLDQKFVKKIHTTVTRNKAAMTAACLRCNGFESHTPIECNVDFNTCWKAGPGDVRAMGEGDSDRNRRDAEELWSQAVQSKKNEISQKQSAKQGSSSTATPTLPEIKVAQKDVPKDVLQNLNKDIPDSKIATKDDFNESSSKDHEDDSRDVEATSLGEIADDGGEGGGFENREFDKGPPSEVIDAKHISDTILAGPKVPHNGLYRPKQSYTGKPEDLPEENETTIASNHVRVTNVPDILYLYSLTYSRTSFKKKKRLIFSKRKEIELAYTAALRKEALNVGSRAVTNFKELWSTAPIHREGLQEGGTWESKEFTFTRPEGITSENVRIEVCYKQKLDNIKQKLQSDSLLHLQDYIRALNAFVLESIKRHNEEQRTAIIQPSASKTFLKYGYMRLQTNLPGSVRANRGYFASIRPGEKDILLNINTVTSAFLPPSKLPDFIAAVGIESASKLLKGAMMMILYKRGPFKGREHIDYNSEEKRTVKFTQFGRKAAEQKFFSLKARNKSNDAKAADPKTAKSVKDYFSDLGLTIPSGNQNEICVNIGKHVRTVKQAEETDEQLMCRQSEEGAIWIPACFLQIKEDQVVRSVLPGGLDTAMINSALRGPAANATMIEVEGFDTIGIHKDPLRDINFEVEKELMRIPARILGQPEMSYKGSKLTSTLASWDIRGRTFYGYAWEKIHFVAVSGCLQPKKGKTEKDLQEQASKEITGALERHGIFKNKNAYRNITPGLDKLPGVLKASGKTDCTVILMPQGGLSIQDYSKIKQIADTLGRHTLCVEAGKLVAEKGAKQVASNLALKINLKRGGDNHRLEAIEKLLGSDKRSKTLIMGADVWHPGKGSREGCPSVASVVGSVDANFMTYRGAMRLQAGSQEKIEDLKDMTIEVLHLWKKHSGGKRLPENILFYRDGVSESQFQHCKDHEIAAIEAAFKVVGTTSNARINITFVVVVKRHNARFYALDSNGTYKMSNGSDNGNVKPGLLVKKAVTNRTPYNFFLQSHQAFKGTARPSHYHVLQDGMNLGTDNTLINLTHTLCYAFSRATKGVSYVAPAYMADRLCERGGVYLREWNNLERRVEPSFTLSDKKLSKKDIIVEKQNFAVKLHKDLIHKKGWD